MPSLTTTPDLLPGEVEQELERRGHRFERYADDCDVHVRSQKLGERALAGLCKIDDRQHLRVNEAKSAVRAPMIASSSATACGSAHPEPQRCGCIETSHAA